MKKLFSIIVLFLLLITTGCGQKVKSVEPNKTQTKLTGGPVNLVFITNRQNLKPCRVAIFSAIKNKKPKSKYNINVIEINLTEAEQNTIRALADKNVNVNVVAPPFLTQKELTNKDITNEISAHSDLFKLMMPQLLPKQDKVLYIDEDMLVLDDLSQLYNTDVKDKYIAVTLSGNNKGLKKERTDAKPNYKIETGVIIYNLDKWRKNDIEKTASKYQTSPEVSAKKIFRKTFTSEDYVVLDPVYDAKPRWADNSVYWYQGETAVDKSTLDNAVIIHYSKEKPWEVKDTESADLWWKYSNELDKLDKTGKKK